MKKRDKVYKHIYSFEADPFNFERAAKNLLGYNNIDLIHCGISSKRIDLKFICSYETDGLKSVSVKKLYTFRYLAKYFSLKSLGDILPG